MNSEQLPPDHPMGPAPDMQPIYAYDALAVIIDRHDKGQHCEKCDGFSLPGECDCGH